MKKLFLFLTIFLFPVNFCYALTPLGKIIPNERILIIAPHPDDEILATGGVIQKALENHARIKVLYITDGEHNIPSLIFYEKSFFKVRRKSIDLGNIRRQESIKACEVLGLKEKNLIFLDYPDSGILKIFLEHWGKRKPFKDSLTHSTHIEKNEGISPHSLYKGENILNDIEKILLDFKPDKIFLPSPGDKNPDHIGSYLFLKLALLDLEGLGKKPELYLYLVHREKISIFERYHPEFYLNFNSDVDIKKDWVELRLSEEEKLKKKKAILKFKTQMYCKKFLLSFAEDEIFEKDLNWIIISQGKKFENYFRRKNMNIGKSEVFLKKGTISYNIDFFRRVNINALKGKFFIYGYKGKNSFSELPKIYLHFRGKRWGIYNQGKNLEKDSIYFRISKKKLEIGIPISKLDNPEFIFTSIKISSDFYNFYLPWKIIKLE